MRIRKRKVAQTKLPSAPTVDFARQVNQLIPAQVFMIGGCHSKRACTDASIKRCTRGKLPIIPAGQLGGVYTSALLGVLQDKQGKNLTYQQLLLDLRESLSKSGFDETLQMTSSRELELNDTPFSLGGSGCRRALLVGINYNGEREQLDSCTNDILNMKKYIMEHEGYEENNIIVLIDDEKHPHSPTRELIIQALQRLVARSASGDSVYFHYAGYGGLLSPQWNTFKKNLKTKTYDETLYPADYSESGQILEFSLFNHFIKPMAAGVKVTCVMDCCHGGSVLDLPYTYKPSNVGKVHMRHSLDSLSNLAFLYILAGGMLPAGLDDVTNRIEDTTGGGIDDHYGLGIAEIANDTSTVDHFPDYYLVSQEIEKSNMESLELDEHETDSYSRADEGGTVFTAIHTEAYTAYTNVRQSSDSRSLRSNSDSSNYDEEDHTECGCVVDVISLLFDK